MLTATAERGAIERKSMAKSRKGRVRALAVKKATRESGNFWRRLRTLREAAGLQQRELSDKLDISRSAVTQWERNVTQPSLAMIERLAVVLKTTPEFLAFGLKSGRIVSDPDTVHVPVVSFSAKGKAQSSISLGLDRPFFTALGMEDTDGLRAFAVMDDPGVQGVKAGDRIIYDENSKRIATDTPIALMVHDSPRIAIASMIPGRGRPQARITIGEQKHDMPVDKIDLLGRVVSVLHQAG